MIDDRLRREILELGLEDDIPLSELAGDCRAAGLIGDGPAGIDALARALAQLARTGEIRVLVGAWNDPEPRQVQLDDAERLLADRRQYSSDEEIAHGLERVFYVNRDNVVE
ncbi:hypothetical protein [Pengzhenrongella phosphoraccumulans]|uniref:hypothetical protein n=1 Tax=Pengzhenrongella phosphoraccumulans TaxID=3114394 RepID=UPI00389021F6